jgi:hypothetical protein
MPLCDHSEHRKNVRVVGKARIASVGAGQIIVEDGTAYVAHMHTEGVTLVDVRNPSKPEVLSKIPAPLKGHSHKVQVCGNLMIVNNERYKKFEPWEAGVRVYDVSDRKFPREIGFWRSGGIGVHRMWFVDGRYAHVTAGMKGFTHQIYVILDLQDPTRPQVVSRWWLPGMWEEGGELPDWPLESKVRAHGPPYVLGNRAYVGWTDGGLTILDISDLTKPSLVARFNVTPPFGGLTHTVMPLPERGLMVVTNEAHEPFCQEPEKHVWLFDIRYEKNPVPIAVASVESEGFCQKGGRFGPHNIHENRPGSMIDDRYIYVTYFNGGLRILDIQDRYRPLEAGYFIPERPEGQEVVQTNDVFVDVRGLIYIVDRLDGHMYILERTEQSA